MAIELLHSEALENVDSADLPSFDEVQRQVGEEIENFVSVTLGSVGLAGVAGEVLYAPLPIYIKAPVTAFSLVLTGAAWLPVIKNKFSDGWNARNNEGTRPPS